MASARCYVDAVIMGPDNAVGTQAMGYYDDVLVRRDDGWRIVRRQFTLVSVRPIPPPTGA